VRARLPQRPVRWFHPQMDTLSAIWSASVELLHLRQHAQRPRLLSEIAVLREGIGKARREG
jgi:hypothetical protein